LETANETFFSQVNTLAPNLVLTANLGGQANPSDFPRVFVNVPGELLQELVAKWTTSHLSAMNGRRRISNIAGDYGKHPGVTTVTILGVNGPR
jgi:hypothetical protein